ncbi:MAG: YciI family protein [Acidimicrobiales bacterium]
MRYLMLIYSDESKEPKPGTSEFDQYFKDYNDYTDEVKEKGKYQLGQALQPVSTATTVRVRDGKATPTDGPFAETKEQLGGFYLFDCDDLDQAIEWAARIPHAANGTIEIRPVVDFSEHVT